MDRAERISRRLQLRHLRTLLAVTQCGSMAKAAQQLAVTQPVVSKTIAELEDVIGQRLFDRTPQGVKPTLFGDALLKRSAAVLADLRTGISELEHLADPTAGELRLGFEENLATGLMPALVQQLGRKYPRLVFNIALGDPATLQSRDLATHKVELAIMRAQSAPLDKIFDRTVLFDDRMWIVAGARSPWARRRKLTLADLVDAPWCLPPPDHPVGALIEDAFSHAGLNPPTRAVTVGSAQSTSHMVARGQYLGVLGSMFLHFKPPSVALKILPVDLSVAAPPICVVTLKDRMLSPAAQMFVEFARTFTSRLSADIRKSR